MPAGPKKRRRSFWSAESANLFAKVEFEKYTFLDGYEAICSYSTGYLEAAVSSATLGPTSAMRRLIQVGAISPDTDSIHIAPPEGRHGPSIEFGPPSPEFSALAKPYGRLTFKLRGGKFSRNDQAMDSLRTYADSFFFQLDMLSGQSFFLQRERRLLAPIGLRRPRAGVASLSYPHARYSPEAMSLYWYAKSARDQPLLKYLSFYQCVEYYFPRYSQVEARRQIAAIVRRPTFRGHSDDDLDQIVSAIRVNRSGGIGDERAQLRAVIAECISAKDMRSFLIATDERSEHFSGKDAKRPFKKISIRNENADLRDEVAERIYDIRCRIVHTKDDKRDDLPKLLPFSEDAEYLGHDVELIQYVASAVLAYSSQALP